MSKTSLLVQQFGGIDIYLFDQLLRGRIGPGMRIVDAGCGGGRNLVYLLRMAAAGEVEVYGNDADASVIDAVRRMASAIAPSCPPENFRNEKIEESSFGPAFADVVISSAVLHFARSDSHFLAMLTAMWEILKPGGLFFCRLASSIGTADQVVRLQEHRYLLPDGSERYLVDAKTLYELTDRLGAHLLDPLKTTVVQDQRSMTTWVLRKNPRSTGEVL